MEKYDPMADFYRRAIEWIFKQGVAVVLCIIFCLAMGVTLQILWGKIDRMETAFEAKIERNNRDWSASLADARQDWRDCETKREALALEVTQLKAQFMRLSKR